MALSPLLQLRDEALSCTSCRLHETRTHVVFGVGLTDKPAIAFVGEAPGENEDKQGEPFVGKAGQLLTQYLTKVGYTREHVFITNTVLCRPPRNRVPLLDEQRACARFLDGQLDEVMPRAIVALGATAAQALLKTQDRIGALRGSWWTWGGIPLRATYHPSYLLREPNKRVDFEADMAAVLRLLAT